MVTAPPINFADWNPDHRPYQPFGAAKKLFECRDREISTVGPAGTGKTRAVLERIVPG